MVQGGCCCAWHCTHRVCTELFPTYRFEFKRIIQSDCMRMNEFFCCCITHTWKLVVYVVLFISRKLRKKDYKLFAACTQDTDQMNCFRFADVSECSFLHASHLFHPCFCCCFGSVFMGLGKVFCMRLRKKWRILPSLVPVNRFHFTGN